MSSKIVFPFKNIKTIRTLETTRFATVQRHVSAQRFLIFVYLLTSGTLYGGPYNILISKLSHHQTFNRNKTNNVFIQSLFEPMMDMGHVNLQVVLSLKSPKANRAHMLTFFAAILRQMHAERVLIFVVLAAFRARDRMRIY